MTAILGWLSILRGHKPVRDVPSTLAIIERNAKMQAQLIDDLLDMNRLASGTMQLELAAVDLALTLRSARQALQPAADAKRVRLVEGIDPRATPVRGDARRLQQVVWNLVQNALKFTPAGGQVELRLEREAHETLVTVSDTGRGIAPAFLPHVFERFRQQDSSTAREAGGIGLGLSIAKHLVELHGGTIAAFSDGEGKGARFVVRLPAADPAPYPRANAVDQPGPTVLSA
jgi:signal transduction histidine kinase